MTKIKCCITKEEYGLIYYGYPIGELAEKSTFEETTYLLLNGELPTQKQLTQWTERIIACRKMPELLKKVLDCIPATAHPMDVTRTAVSVLGIAEPEKTYEDVQPAVRLLGVLPAIIGYISARLRGKEFKPDSEEKTIAGYLLEMLIGRTPTETERKMMDASLILYAEHGLTASTFSARVCAATMADYYGCITNGIATLSGKLHGGANEAVVEMLSKFDSVAQAEETVKNMLKNREKVIGFGHPVYISGDPRNPMIKEWARRLAEEKNEMKLFAIADAVETLMGEEKNLFANLDFYSGTSYYLTGIEIPLYTPIFVLSRSSGWSAHVFEQRSENVLIRPVANYTGTSKREYMPIEQRS
ncbi:MAG: citrate/2-methylcitrate synthase [Candidatus Hodarchaeales archaeon]|jgi:2-methylcitrate synthase